MKKFVVLLSIAVSSSVFASELSWDALNKYIIASDKNYDYSAHSSDYMESFQRAKFDKFHLDEFEFDNKKTETAAQMKDMASKFNVDESYTINAQVWFGQYSFEKNEFPITFTSIPSDITQENMPGIYPDGLFYNFQPNYPESASDAYRLNMRVKFTNADKLSGIKLDKEKAKSFLQSHKSGSMINRNLPIVVTVKIKSVTPSDQDNYVSDANVEIIKAVIFADNNRKKIISEQTLGK